MYYGSNYCIGCKYNRDCYSSSINPYNNQETNCIIMHKIFEKEYKKINKEVK